MKVVILMGSPRKEGNTASLVKPFADALKEKHADCVFFDLYDMEVNPCVACRTCQQDWNVFGCPQKDDMQRIFDEVLEADLLVVATPIYSWYCTPPVKNVMDRLVYGMNKYYGREMGPSLWRGKKLALISTCGYPIEKGADLWETGMRRYCKHSKLEFVGMAAERQRNYGEPFMDEEKERKITAFAMQCIQACLDNECPVCCNDAF